MSHPTRIEIVNEVRRLYDDGQSMAQIAAPKGWSVAWVRKLLIKTGGTRPRGHNLTAEYRQEHAQPQAVE